MRNNDIINIDFSEINSYTISTPSSYVTSDDFIKITFIVNRRKLSLIFVNKSIPDEIVSGESFIFYINNYIKNINNTATPKIELKESFFASNNGKFFYK
jgi:hypothetical protein